MYKIKEDAIKVIKEKFKASYIAKEVGISIPYISLIFAGKKTCPKRTAFCITKMIDEDAEIENYFERIA